MSCSKNNAVMPVRLVPATPRTLPLSHCDPFISSKYMDFGFNSLLTIFFNSLHAG